MRDSGRERDAGGAQKTTLSKEGFKDYQLRLPGNLWSCILSTSKGHCVLEYCKWESEGGRDGDGGGGESDFSNKCWHQACLILDSGNSLICYRLWNSSDVLQRDGLTTATPRHRRKERRAPGCSHNCLAIKMTIKEVLIGSLSVCLSVETHSAHTLIHYQCAQTFEAANTSVWLKSGQRLCGLIQCDSTLLQQLRPPLYINPLI